MPKPLALDKFTRRFRLPRGKRVDLADIATRADGDWDKSDARAATIELRRKLLKQQELLAATDSHALLIVLQAMDAGGKDSTIRNLSRGLNVAEAQVASFKAPTEEERRHDFLWRIHQRVPPLGKVGIFNRSHYEDVLVVRVKQLAPRKVWRARYDQINAFESLLAAANVTILKFFLHISKDYQTSRLQRRLDLPEKHWKLSEADLRERKRWGEYQKAYEDALSRCNTADAPWFVIPAERRWFRDMVITQIVVETIENLGLEYPPPSIDPATVVLD